MGSSRCRRRLSAPRLLVVALLGMTLVSGCQEQAKERSPSSHDLVVSPITLEPGGAEISYRYIDPESGAVGTAASVEAIPEAARRQVVVYHALHPTPPGWEHVADLTSGLPTSTVPRRGFQLQPRRAPQGGSSGAPAAAPPVAVEPPMRIIAAIDKAGLGLTSWWPGDEGGDDADGGEGITSAMEET